MSSFIVLPAEFGDENPVRQPRAARNTRGPHRYDSTVVNNKVVGYVGTQYDRADHEFPKMLYHPSYAKTPKPEEARFAVGAVTQEQIQNAAKAFQEALAKWNRSNRTMLATDVEHEERLIKKGWLKDPPKSKEAAAFDLSSEEI